jgi:hypothetical protein
LPMSLGFIMAMADHGGAGTARAANAVRPSIVPDRAGAWLFCLICPCL